MLVGLLAGTQVREEMPTVPEDEQPASGPFFRWAYLGEYRQLFILFLVIMLAAIGMNVAFPYLIIYLENFIGVGKSQFAVIGGGIMLVSGLLAIPFGILADRWNKKWVLLADYCFGSGLLALFFGAQRADACSGRNFGKVSMWRFLLPRSPG